MWFFFLNMVQIFLEILSCHFSSRNLCIRISLIESDSSIQIRWSVVVFSVIFERNSILDVWCLINWCRKNHPTKSTLNQYHLFGSR
jgi:hypothetical protein